jgi:serine/threonine protein kinase
MQMAGKFHDVFCSMLMTQVCWILQELHDEGWIYRDIKASNFMLEVNGKLKLIDLGLAKRIGKKRTYTVCGTVHSMPPEVLLGTSKEGYSYEFDYYGLGVLIYELTVGVPPFGYHTTNSNIKQGTVYNYM